MIAAERITMQGAFMQNLRAHEKFTKMPQEDQAAIIRRLERACFNASIDSASANGISPVFTDQQFLNIYSMECHRVLSNLNPETAFDTYLIDNIVGGQIDVTKIALLKNSELSPAAAQSERDMIELRLNQKTEIKVSTRFKCKKCGEKQTKPLEYQSRAGDEASSQSIKCVMCGEVWR